MNEWPNETFIKYVQIAEISSNFQVVHVFYLNIQYRFWIPSFSCCGGGATRVKNIWGHHLWMSLKGLHLQFTFIISGIHKRLKEIQNFHLKAYIIIYFTLDKFTTFNFFTSKIKLSIHIIWYEPQPQVIQIFLGDLLWKLK